MKNQKAFTLVELIVVVTILAILATIGFVSYSGYLTGVRDTNRIASLAAISDGLELYRTRNDLPDPDDAIDIQVEGIDIAHQGYVGVNVLQTIEYSKAGKDPKDDNYYSYYLTDDKKYYQLMAFLEESDNLESTNVFSNTHAATSYKNRHPKVYGKRLGILTDVDNTPVQEIERYIDSGNIDILSSSTGVFISHLTDSAILMGSGLSLTKLKQIANEGGKFWNVSGENFIVTQLEGGKVSTCLDLKNMGNITSGNYTIYPAGIDINVYCDMTTDGGGWTRVLDYNGEQLAQNTLDIDWYQDSDNYSYLYSFKNIKNTNNRYEFLVYGNNSSTQRWHQFTQSNAYDENPNPSGTGTVNENNYTKIAGDFRDNYYNPNRWSGLALGKYGNSVMQSDCVLASSYGSHTTSTWRNCMIDTSSGYGTGPWDSHVSPTDRIRIYQR